MKRLFITQRARVFPLQHNVVIIICGIAAIIAVIQTERVVGKTARQSKRTGNHFETPIKAPMRSISQLNVALLIEIIQ